eukprot:GEMP01018017.1.p1 GENE.GEMP01018017.1~~GEMP01018017.1.p1  ORF type:complete len:716 (+),score=137.92 GEMP01018017.1:197-2344(+)
MTITAVLPLLPGNTFEMPKVRYPKPQIWTSQDGIRLEVKEGYTHDRIRLVKAPRADGNGYETRPAWDAFDRCVLRFYGRFKDTSKQQYCNDGGDRFVKILYFLEDDTMAINEISDGVCVERPGFVRRHRIPNVQNNDGYFTPDNLRIGGIIEVYSRRFYITGCDGFTRRYYEEAHDAQPVDEFVPELRKKKECKDPRQPRTYEKMFTEVMLGGGHYNHNMSKFMVNDRKVCRFSAVVDDLNTTQYERKPFVLFYYLADDTIMIREEFPPNCGRDAFPVFYRRARMPRGSPRPHGLMRAPYKEDDYIGLKDFAVGVRLVMMNTIFYIYDADHFTRAYYENELGTALRDKIDVSLLTKTVPVAPTPEYTGYGSMEDSMGSVNHLSCQPPRKDTSNFYINADKVLRFRARMCDSQAGGDRDFVINYYLQDDTFCIHVPHDKGTGELTGKFLERGQHTNERTGANAVPQDFVPPAQVRFYGQDFEIYEPDEYTRKYFVRLDDPGAAEPVPCDLDIVLSKLRSCMGIQQKRCREIFRRFDLNRDGVLTEEEFTFALKKFGFTLTTAETHKLMRYFDSSQSGQIVYNEFCDAVYDPDYIDSELKRTVNLSDQEIYSSRAVYRRECRKEDAEIRRAVRLMGEVLHTRPNLVKRLRFELDNIAGKEKLIDVEMLTQGFKRCGYTFTTEDVKRCMMYIFNDTRINYVKFLARFQASFHDFFALR